VSAVSSHKNNLVWTGVRPLCDARLERALVEFFSQFPDDVEPIRRSARWATKDGFRRRWWNWRVVDGCQGDAGDEEK
jgi:hypothetical protein